MNIAMDLSQEKMFLIGLAILVLTGAVHVKNQLSARGALGRAGIAGYMMEMGIYC